MACPDQDSGACMQFCARGNNELERKYVYTENHLCNYTTGNGSLNLPYGRMAIVLYNGVRSYASLNLGYQELPVRFEAIFVDFWEFCDFQNHLTVFPGIVCNPLQSLVILSCPLQECPHKPSIFEPEVVSS